jgi:hypothetical protein
MNEFDYMVNYFVMSMVALLLVLTTGMFFLIALRFERLLDRYRIKYGFDREIESKEISKEDTELKLNRREHNFKRRVFKD